MYFKNLSEKKRDWLENNTFRLEYTHGHDMQPKALMI